MADKKEILDDEKLDEVNGGFIVDRGVFNYKDVVDGNGNMLASSYMLKNARKLAAQAGVSDMVITRDERDELRMYGYFTRDGVKYSEVDGTVITE